MKKKCYRLGWWCLLLAIAIYVAAYFLFHYLSPEGGFRLVYQETPAKPFVTLLLAIWGVLFQFAGVMSFLVGKIFFSGDVNAS